jgi:hypothetical protein
MRSLDTSSADPSTLNPALQIITSSRWKRRGCANELLHVLFALSATTASVARLPP